MPIYAVVSQKLVSTPGWCDVIRYHVGPDRLNH